MVRINVIESRVPAVMATAKEFLVVFMMALAVTSILGAIIFSFVHLFTHVMGWM